MRLALGERYLFDLDAAFNDRYVIARRAGAAQATEWLFRELLRLRTWWTRLRTKKAEPPPSM